MKRLNNLFALVLFCLFFISCGNLFESKKNTTEKDYNLTLNLRNGGTGNSSRTISSVSGWNVSDLTWTVEFYNSSNAKITPVEASEDGKSYRLSSGTYTVKVSALYDGHTIYGEKEVDIVEGETASVSIEVGLKKSATGSGSIGEITVDLTEALSKVSTSEINAKLVSVKSNEDKIELTPDSSGNMLILTKSGIPSGYYYLQVEMAGIYGSEDMVNLVLSDSLVEIADGETVSASLKALNVDAYINYYASYVGTGNGLTPSNRISYGNLLNVLKNKGSTRYVNVYFNEGFAFDLNELSEIPHASEDDYVNFVITTDYYTYQIVYSCYNKNLCSPEGAVHLRINNGNVKQLEVSAPASLVTLDLHNKATVELDAYKNSEEDPIYFIGSHTDENHGSLDCDATLADYYKGTGIPFLTNIIGNAIAEPLNIEVDAGINCEVVYTVEDAPAEYGLPGWKLYSYYLAPTGSAEISTATAIPEFEIIETNKGLMSGKDYEFYAMNLSFVATPKTGNFLGNTSFVWKLNDHVIGSSVETLNIETNSTDVYLNVSGSNILVCEATYDDGNKKAYKSATFELNYTNPVAEGMVWVAGTTIKGTETWTPVSEVFVSGRKLLIPDLFVSDHEVTRGEFATVMGEELTQEFMDGLTSYLTNVYDKDGNKVTGDALRNLPMSRVNWYHAMAYCNKLSLKEGLTPCYSVEGIDDWGYLKFTDIPGFSNASLTEEEQNLVAPWNAATCDFSANGYRLPTDAEWEWLARGGNDHTEYAGSDNIDEVAWYQKGNWGPHLVKLLKPNGYGLYDMTGNVYEMCWDKDAYPITSSTPATGAVSGDYRVVRGGSYYSSASQCSFNPYFEYSSDWNEEIDYVMCYDYGFRVVRTDTNSKNNGFVLINAGTFMMGTDYGSWYGPAHQVKLTRNYLMCDHEVTQAEYEAVMGENPSDFKTDSLVAGEIQKNRPVEFVSYHMAFAYCNKRSVAEGLTPVYSLLIDGVRTTDVSKWPVVPEDDFYADIYQDPETNEWVAPTFNIWLTVEQNLDANGYRLPTEAEWEYAARAGNDIVDEYIFIGANDSTKIGDYAWYGGSKGNSGNVTHEVKKKKPNAWGLYDMCGNVSEYCWDWYDNDVNYTVTGDITENPCLDGDRESYYFESYFSLNKEPESYMRGGSYMTGSSDINGLALTNRDYNYHYYQASMQGFRVVRTFTD